MEQGDPRGRYRAAITALALRSMPLANYVNETALWSKVIHEAGIEPQ